MRTMLRNKRPVWYALYLRDEPILDEYGFDTGETQAVYSDPVELPINVSPATGNTEDTPFGEFVDYDHSMVTERTDLPIEEGTRIWFGAEPPAEHNYTVVRVASSVNGTAYAIKKVLVQ